MAEDRRDELRKASRDMLTKVGEYVRGETEVLAADYAAMERLNKAATAKYEGMTEFGEGLVAHAHGMERKYKEFEPYLEQIDVMEQGVGELEQVITMLQEYTKRLERRFRRLEQQRAKLVGTTKR